MLIFRRAHKTVQRLISLVCFIDNELGVVVESMSRQETRIEQGE